MDQSGIIKEIPASVPAWVYCWHSRMKPVPVRQWRMDRYPVITSSPQITSSRERSPIFAPISTHSAPPGIHPCWNGYCRSTCWEVTLQLASLINGPKNLKQVSLSPAPQREESNMLTFFLPYAVTMLFYIIILSAASLLLSSVAKEKENRVMEILMVSVTPRQLLTGKIVGLGLLGLLQTIAWVGTGRILLARSGTTFNLPIAFQLPPSFLIWALIFFLLGYAVYASLMAGLGALVPNLREASQATILVIFPLIIPIFLLSVLINEPQQPARHHSEHIPAHRTSSDDDPPISRGGAFLADLAVCGPAGAHRTICGAGSGTHVPRPNHSIRSAIQPEIILQCPVWEIVEHTR